MKVVWSEMPCSHDIVKIVCEKKKQIWLAPISKLVVPRITREPARMFYHLLVHCHLSRMYNLESSAERALGNPFCAILFTNPGVIDHVERL